MEILLTAVTWMKKGVCFAGLNCRTGEWVRPVLDRAQWNSLTHANGQLIEVGQLINLNNPRLRPDPPHTEDVVVDGFSLVRKLSDQEFQSVLDRHAEDIFALTDTINYNERSLCLVKADSFKTVYTENDDDRKTRLSFRFRARDYNNTTKTKPGFPCTDVRWRALKAANQADPRGSHLYIGIGLARSFQSDDGSLVPPASMVISVLTFPPFKVMVDPRNY
jgi:hypothetical protein